MRNSDAGPYHPDRRENHSRSKVQKRRMRQPSSTPTFIATARVQSNDQKPLYTQRYQLPAYFDISRLSTSRSRWSQSLVVSPCARFLLTFLSYSRSGFIREDHACYTLLTMRSDRRSRTVHSRTQAQPTQTGPGTGLPVSRRSRPITGRAAFKPKRFGSSIRAVLASRSQMPTLRSLTLFYASYP